MDFYRALIIILLILFAVFLVLVNLIITTPRPNKIVYKNNRKHVDSNSKPVSDQHSDLTERLERLEQLLIPVLDLSKKHESILSGSQSKGALGEHMVENILKKLPLDWIEPNVPLSGGTVEFALRTPDKRWIPIDSQWTAPTDLLTKLERASSQAERTSLKKEIQDAVSTRAQNAMRYLDKENTLGFGIVVVPDFVFSLCTDIQANLASRNIVLISHSLLVPYILLIVNQYLKNIQATNSLKRENLLSSSVADIELIQKYIQTNVVPTLEVANRQQAQFIRQNQELDSIYTSIEKIQAQLRDLREMVSPVPSDAISTIPQILQQGLNHVKGKLLDNDIKQNGQNNQKR